MNELFTLENNLETTRKECGLSLFSDLPKNAPLAARLRPASLEEFVGQGHLLAPGKPLRRLLEADRLQSLILYGPPGSGKTSLAYILANVTKSHFEMVNAVLSNVSELKKCLEGAVKRKKMTPHRANILFIDEIHRFSASQQDILMPYVESGTIVLFGATTHNPYFSINSPLLSRSLIFELQPLENEEVVSILTRGLQKYETDTGIKVIYEKPLLFSLAKQCSGDARRGLTLLDMALWLSQEGGDKQVILNDQLLSKATMKRHHHYDRAGDEHFDVISAFIKSLRGSDPDAALHWLARMLVSGEDIRFIVRRMLIFASEDIGNADPHALVLASACLQAVTCVGMPESRIILAQCALYLATAPKSNASYTAIEDALRDVEDNGAEEVPAHLKSSQFQGAKELKRGIGYAYPHDFSNHWVDQPYRSRSKVYYQPSDQGYEQKIRSFLSALKKSS